MMTNGSPNSTGWPSSNRIWITVPARGAGIVTQILIEDGQPVEFGEPLMIVE